MKKILLTSILFLLGLSGILFGATPNITLSVDRIDMNSVSVIWDTLPTSYNVTGYKIVYSKNNVPYSTTDTANIKDVGIWEMKTNSNNVYYTLRPIDYGSIYNAFVVPVMANNVSWTAMSNLITFTTRSENYNYFMTNRDDMAIKDLVGSTINAVTVSSGENIISLTPTAENWYITDIILSCSLSGGVAVLRTNDGTTDELKDVISVNSPISYSIPFKIQSGTNLYSNLAQGDEALYFLRIKYFIINKYGK
jgi:hypothetical protein